MRQPIEFEQDVLSKYGEIRKEIIGMIKFILCKLGIHDWQYGVSKKVRWCRRCPKDQELKIYSVRVFRNISGPFFIWEDSEERTKYVIQ